MTWQCVFSVCKFNYLKQRIFCPLNYIMYRYLVYQVRIKARSSMNKYNIKTDKREWDTCSQGSDPKVNSKLSKIPQFLSLSIICISKPPSIPNFRIVSSLGLLLFKITLRDFFIWKMRLDRQTDRQVNNKVILLGFTAF